ncbi:MAG: FAD binding domain-containing protein [Ilumatobacter sp.]|uniref:FAD binding domain-containing protein n=1 Tax=Ilumatobacter sp. TaxID=1967498 RepID=UPI002609E692|nr:FAD binding domain-containing protein [Ilumatobacter sp.]MDJ0770103.1 FAD binding domain-containing protein [Ilumatobacter sp.]
MIDFPETYAAIDVPEGAVVRSGGTDLQERLRSHNAQPRIVDLTGVQGFAGIDRSPDRVHIGGGTTMAVVARELAATHPALAIATGSLATPQIRAQGTIAGNLTQHTRCWYYRHPDTDCFKSGGDSCPARTGRHLYGVVFDRSECVHPHPSTIAMALLCYDTTIVLADGSTRPIDEVLGDGTDPTRDHQLAHGEVIAAIELTPGWADERGAYFRSISRFEAEWPLVEAVARARFDDDRVAECALALGGVATVPLRMAAAEQVLTGSTLDDASIRAAAEVCAEGATPLPETGYKVELIVATVIETLERLRAA